MAPTVGAATENAAFTRTPPSSWSVMLAVLFVWLCMAEYRDPALL